MKRLLFVLLMAMPCWAPAAADTSFGQCAAGLRAQASAAGISNATLDLAFHGLEPAPGIIQRDRRQFEFVASFWDYVERTVTDRRVQRGRALRRQHAGLLNRIDDHFGVRGEHLLALWGMETNYGSILGRNPVLQSLATLACDQRRRELFQNEFVSALTIIERGFLDPLKLKGSWAGAMGQVQFLPSTYLQHAHDFDGDGRRDIFESLPDALASAANYLKSIGWQTNQRWGREVVLPRNPDWTNVAPGEQREVKQWAEFGITTAFGEKLPAASLPARLRLPAGQYGPAFLTYPNFDVTMEWNRSTSFALAVGILADRIAGSAGLVTPKPRGLRRLKRSQVIEIQNLLNELGFDSGEPDGVIGRQTRNAVRAFQLANGLDADGYPDQSLLGNLRNQKRMAN